MSTLACLPFGACNESTLGLFILVLIQRTPAFDVATINALFDTVAFVAASSLSGAPSFGSALAFDGALPLDSALAFGADFAGGAGAAFFKATSDKTVPEPLSAAEAFGAVTFRPDTFARLPASPAPMSSFFFLAASLLAFEPGSKRGP
jgi:hypothetical protein